jgi:hypothetical protein
MLASMRPIAVASLAAALVFVLSGCPSRSNDSAPSSGSTSTPAKCTKFGDNCEYAPGKLGSCVVRAGCTEGDCLVCQSQH